MTVTRGSVL